MSRSITSTARPQSLTLREIGFGLIVVAFGAHNLGTIQRRMVDGCRIYGAIANDGRDLGTFDRQFEAVRQIQSSTF
jgi:hypothetical protein